VQNRHLTSGFLGSGTLTQKRTWPRATEAPARLTGSPVAETDLLTHDLVLTEIVGRLVAVFQPERVYLFVSLARGDAGPDSAYDMVVVVPDDAPTERRRSRLAHEVLSGTGVAVDELVCTHSYFDARRPLKAWLPGTILREGRLLNAT